MVDEYGHRLRGFTLRMEEELRKEVERRGKKAKRDLNKEINYRVQESIYQEDQLYSNIQLVLDELQKLRSQVSDLESQVEELIKK